MLKRSIFILVPTALFVGGCATLEPPLPSVEPGIEESWQSSFQPSDEAVLTSEIGWRAFFQDAKLQQLIALGLENNRDLRVAAHNIERAAALYRVNRSELYPSVGAGAGMTRSRGNAGQPKENYSIDVGVASYEIDLFGRIRSLSEAALQSYLATEEAERALQIALVGNIATTYLSLAGDIELQRIALAMVRSFEEELALSEERFKSGAVSALALSQSKTIVFRAKADAASYEGRVAQGKHALEVLVGARIAPELYPTDFETDFGRLADLPAGLPSEVLLQRPDIVAAEYQLIAANARIGAARAAFFPSISLTGAVGFASSDLGDLFKDDSATWSFSPRVNLPIFQGGRLRANRDVAIADQDIAVASYEKAIQEGFLEVADSLALSKTLVNVRSAIEELLVAATKTHELSQIRYQEGQDSYLILLDAQRTLFSAQQELVATKLAEQTNRVSLYRVLGGGWKEVTGE